MLYLLLLSVPIATGVAAIVWRIVKEERSKPKMPGSDTLHEGKVQAGKN